MLNTKEIEKKLKEKIKTHTTTPNLHSSPKTRTTSANLFFIYSKPGLHPQINVVQPKLELQIPQHYTHKINMTLSKTLRGASM